MQLSAASSRSHGLAARNPRQARPLAARRPRRTPAAAAQQQELAVDVAVVGAGVIGLCSALALLQADRKLSVALLDQAVPCAGATGAGQGYIWMAHRDSSSPAWDLALHSKQLWEEWLETPGLPQLSSEAVEFQLNGSMLVASSPEETAALYQRQQLLAAAGVRATHAEPGIAARLEPALQLAPGGSALLVPDDLQINGKAAAAALQRGCEALGRGSGDGRRFTALFHEAAEALAVGPSGRVEAVQTSAGRRVRAARGVVVAAGAWSGEFLARQAGELGLDATAAGGWAGALRPRKGLLLEMARPEGMPEVHRGMMELGYTKHYDQAHRQAEAAAEPAAGGGACSAADITFTATTSASGTLLVGSSREFGGFDSDPEPEVVGAIMQRAVRFLPGLAAVKQGGIDVRAGPRPFAVRGLPFVGPVPGAEGLYIAAGHEGSGLTLGPATAELVCHYVLGSKPALPERVLQALLP